MTPAVLGSTAVEVLGWDGPEGRRGWMTLPAGVPAPPEVHSTHLAVREATGGIVATFGAPEDENTRWSGNHRGILTPSSAASDVFVGAVQNYAWLWEDSELEVPITPTDYYVVAEEWNGNLTVAHRTTGQVLLFAPTTRTTASRREGCPPYSLYTFDDAPDLAAWIETSASQWA